MTVKFQDAATQVDYDIKSTDRNIFETSFKQKILIFPSLCKECGPFLEMHVWNLSSSKCNTFHESSCSLWLFYIVIPLSSSYLNGERWKEFEQSLGTLSSFQCTTSRLNLLKNIMQQDPLVSMGASCLELYHHGNRKRSWSLYNPFLFVLPHWTPQGKLSVVFLSQHFIGSFYKREQLTHHKYLQDFQQNKFYTLASMAGFL